MKLLPHEETLVMLWQVAMRRDDFESWMMVSHQCCGAAVAVMDYPRGAIIACDYSSASGLAIFRAMMAPVTPPPACMSQAREAA